MDRTFISAFDRETSTSRICRVIRRVNLGFLTSHCLLLLVVSFGASMLCTAQEDSVHANPSAVKLRRIWSVTGAPGAVKDVGQRVGALGDINGDHIDDFAVERRDTLDVFLGAKPAPSVVAFQSIPNTFVHISSHFAPTTGDHWGTGHSAIGLLQGLDFVLLRTESGRLDDTIALRWPRRVSDTFERALGGAVAADLDFDGYDELILAQWASSNGQRAEILIYRGGPNFQIDTPAVIIHEDELNESNGNYWVGVADVDGDSHLDILTNAMYPTGWTLNIHFGAGVISPDRWLESRRISGPGRIEVGDIDGDRVSDIHYAQYVFLSNGGKSARTRSFDTADADAAFRGGPYMTYSRIIGSLNDSAMRYAMIGRFFQSMYAFSGSRTGPDLAYDAYYAPSLDGFSADIWYSVSQPLGDVNGDGWSDAGFGDRYYPSDVIRYGIALILSGGPYIPRDSIPVNAIRDIAIDGKPDAFTLWPLPATSHVNIAWRGDLSSMPRKYELFDMTGTKISSGEISFGASQIVIPLEDVASGVYLVVVTDRASTQLMSERILKR